MRRVVLVGERFNMPRRQRWDEADDERWLRLALRLGAFNDARSRDRLQSLLPDGVTWESALNLTPPAPQGEKFDAARAARVAALLLRQTTLSDAGTGDWLLVLCGRKVARAVGIGWDSPWGAYVAPGYVVVPHPSGLCRVWNDPWELQVIKDVLMRSLSGSSSLCCSCGTQPCDPANDMCHECGRTVCPYCQFSHGRPCLGLFTG